MTHMYLIASAHNPQPEVTGLHHYDMAVGIGVVVLVVLLVAWLGGLFSRGQQ